MKLLEPDQVAKINEIVEKQDTTILNFAQQTFLSARRKRQSHRPETNFVRLPSPWMW
jgi:hypothetical protein